MFQMSWNGESTQEKIENKKTQRSVQWETQQEIYVKTELKEMRQQRKNSARREKYWRDKYFDFLEFEEGDHEDLSCLFEGVSDPSNHVLKEMQCLWEQQRQLLATKEKKQYRWHPK